MMSEKNRFMLGEAMMILGFAYAVNQYLLPCIACGLVSVGLSVRENTMKDLMRDVIHLSLVMIVQFALIRAAGLAEMLVGLNTVVLCNTIFSRIWIRESFAAAETCIRGIVSVMLVFTALALWTPAGEFTVLQSLLIIALMFMPVLMEYVIRVVEEGRKDMMMSVEEKAQLR